MPSLCFVQEQLVNFFVSAIQQGTAALYESGFDGKVLPAAFSVFSLLLCIFLSGNAPTTFRPSRSVRAWVVKGPF
jgi:hypothetical protein